MQVAIVITHNKTDAENTAQIELLKPLIEKQTETHDLLDEEGNPTGETYETYYYTVKGLTGHQAKFYQVVPFGVTPPNNLDDIDSHKVFYGQGDEDKVGAHPRFYNWGLKRGTDYGADMVVHLNDYTKLNVTNLATDLQSVTKTTKTYGVISPKGTEQVKE